MNTLKLCLLVGLLAALSFGCTINVVDTYLEADDPGNDMSSTAEDTGFIMDNWYAIEGSISSSSDDDYYYVTVPAGAENMDFNVYYNGDKVTGILGISLFPFNFVSYDATDTQLTMYLLQAAVNSQDLDPDTAYIIFHVYGNTDQSSGTYSIEFYAY